MPKFKLRDDHGPVSLSSPSWRGGMSVKPGGVVTDLGELITSRPEPEVDPKTGEPIGPAPEPLPEDAYVVRDRNGEERAWPKAVWELQDEPAKTADKPAEKAPDKPADSSAPAPKGK